MDKARLRRRRVLPTLPVVGLFLFTALTTLAQAQVPPSKWFYIRSAANPAGYVLASDPGGNSVHLRPNDGHFRQLWHAEPSELGGYVLSNFATGEVLRSNGFNGPAVTMTDKRYAPSDPQTRWQFDTFGSGSREGLAIFPWLDVNQRLNVAGNGPWDGRNAIIVWEYSKRAPNETWTLVPDTNSFNVDSVNYDFTAATTRFDEPFQDDPPVRIPNLTDQPVFKEIELTQRTYSRRSFTKNEGDMLYFNQAMALDSTLTIPQVASFDDSLKLVLEPKKETAFQLGSDTNETGEATVKVLVKIPAQSVYEYRTRTNGGSMEVPYYVILKRLFPQNQWGYARVYGKFKNVSSTTFFVLEREVTPGRTSPRPVVSQDSVVLSRVVKK
jgi:hypothetical protein